MFCAHLINNYYVQIEEKLQTEELKDMLNEPLGDDESESESNLLKSPQKEKPQCVKLLEEEAEEHHFVGRFVHLTSRNLNLFLLRL